MFEQANILFEKSCNFYCLLLVMSENQRVKEAIFYLKGKKIIRNQQDFCERVGSDKATISQIVNERIKVPNGLFGNIEQAFPSISAEWLKTGDGSMLKDEQPEPKDEGFWQRLVDGLLGQICQKDAIIERLDKQLSEMRKELDNIRCKQ